MATFVDTLRTASYGISQMPAVRQLMMLIGLAASIALGVGVVLWSQEPNYRPLFTHVDHSDMSNILDALDRAHVRYKLDNSSNMVMVPSNQIYKARINVANAGLPKNSSVGFEILSQDQGITTSRFMETARYRHALEGELSRTISHLEGVVDARVHLAIPQQSSFLENDEKPSASVLVHLGGSQSLEKSSIAAISRLVASSIPGLEAHNVTVVDQTGRTLSAEADSNHFAQTKEQFEHKRQFESVLEQRVEAIVTPLIGAAKVRAKITADMDFTHIEQTQENFNQFQPVVRSEEIFNEQRGQFSADEGGAAGGVPGAMSNIPPSAATAVDPNAQNQDGAADNKLSSMRQHTTKNYELGKTISHTLIPSGALQRLSIAVVVDDKASAGKDGKITRTPLSDAEIQQITMLVKNAVGYNEARGDTISVVNSSFAPAKIIEPLPPVPWYEQAWIWTASKTLAGGLFVLMLLMLVIRPVMRSLAEKGKEDESSRSANGSFAHNMPAMMGFQGGSSMMPNMAAATNPQMAMAGGQSGGMMPNMAASAALGAAVIPPEQGWSQLRDLADQDPKRMAQVMNDWVGK